MVVVVEFKSLSPTATEMGACPLVWSFPRLKRSSLHEILRVSNFIKRPREMVCMAGFYLIV